MATRFPKIVTTAHYHLWTDALHARALAQQTRSQWDRGTYVRWAIMSAWTCFELACEDALSTVGLGNDFKRKLDAAVQALSLPKLDWGRGLWQEVLTIYQLRKDYVHPGISQERLFAPVTEAEATITTLRDGIRAIYVHANKNPPDWTEDDHDRGWDDGHRPLANLTVGHLGVNPNDPDAMRVNYVYQGREFTTDVLPPGTDPVPFIYDLLRRVNIPISAIRVYQGDQLLSETPYRMRGS